MKFWKTVEHPSERENDLCIRKSKRRERQGRMKMEAKPTVVVLLLLLLALRFAAVP